MFFQFGTSFGFAIGCQLQILNHLSCAPTWARMRSYYVFAIAYEIIITTGKHYAKQYKYTES